MAVHLEKTINSTIWTITSLGQPLDVKKRLANDQDLETKDNILSVG